MGTTFMTICDLFVVQRGHFTVYCQLEGHPKGHFRSAHVLSTIGGHLSGALSQHPHCPPLSPPLVIGIITQLKLKTALSVKSQLECLFKGANGVSVSSPITCFCTM